VKFQCVKGKERKCYKKLKTIKINYVKRCLISLSVITSKFTTHEMLKFGGLFGKVRCAVIGMVHVGALPGNCFSTLTNRTLLHDNLVTWTYK
jgi:hypothetical protein